MKTACRLLCSLALCAAALAHAAWTPPAKPEPRAILNEARKDRMEERFDDALAKHLWLHREGAKVDPAFHGVRVSFALGDWAHLAVKHPPALAALNDARDAAEADVKAGRNAVPAFDDFAAISRELDEPGRTVALFGWVEARNPALARQMYRSAEHALIAAGDYKTAGKYVDANAAMARVVRVHMSMVRNAPKGSSEQAEEYAKGARDMLGREAGRLVALLVANGREAHAKVLAQQALEVNGAPEVRSAIDAALKGEFPKEPLSREDKATLRQMMP
jgi:hypothetical protein